MFWGALTVASGEMLRRTGAFFGADEPDPDPPAPNPDGSIDPVDQASWESFPASDPPGF